MIIIHNFTKINKYNGMILKLLNLLILFIKIYFIYYMNIL